MSRHKYCQFRVEEQKRSRRGIASLRKKNIDDYELWVRGKPRDIWYRCTTFPIFSSSKSKDEVPFVVLLHGHNCNIAGMVLFVISECRFYGPNDTIVNIVKPASSLSLDVRSFTRYASTPFACLVPSYILYGYSLLLLEQSVYSVELLLIASTKPLSNSFVLN